MNKSIVVVLQTCLLYLALVNSPVAQVTARKDLSSLNGVYEWMSQEIRTKKPSPSVFLLSPPEWNGTWQINDGFFSSQLMKNRREKFFDCNDQDLGYESFAGTYVIDNDQIVFTQKYSLNPLYKGRPVVMRYRTEGNKLIFVQKLTPIIEDLREGIITITLVKVSK